MRHTLKVALGRHVRDPEIHYFETDALTITTDPEQVVTLDGEPHGITPVTIRLVPEALNVFASLGFVDDVGMEPATPSRVFTQFAQGLVRYRGAIGERENIVRSGPDGNRSGGAGCAEMSG